MESALDQQQLMQLDQRILDIAFAARKKFTLQPFRVWFVMLNENAWKVILINTETKEILLTGPIKDTLNGSFAACKEYLKNYNSVKENEN